MKNILLPLSVLLLLFSCKKEKSPSDKMNGERVWHGTDYRATQVYNTSLGQYVWQYTTDTINGKVIDIRSSGNTVTFSGATMTLDSTNAVEHSMYYKARTDAYHEYYLTYYYQKDSISYVYYYNMGHGGSETIKLSTP